MQWLAFPMLWTQPNFKGGVHIRSFDFINAALPSFEMMLETKTITYITDYFPGIDPEK